jgi:hypothetical protein
MKLKYVYRSGSQPVRSNPQQSNAQLTEQTPAIKFSPVGAVA